MSEGDHDTHNGHASMAMAGPEAGYESRLIASVGPACDAWLKSRGLGGFSFREMSAQRARAALARKARKSAESIPSTESIDPMNRQYTERSEEERKAEGKALKLLMAERGLNGAAVARAIGRSPSSISTALKGVPSTEGMQDKIRAFLEAGAVPDPTDRKPKLNGRYAASQERLEEREPEPPKPARPRAQRQPPLPDVRESDYEAQVIDLTREFLRKRTEMNAAWQALQELLGTDPEAAEEEAEA